MAMVEGSGFKEVFTLTTQEQLNASVMPTYGRFPVVIDHGTGESCTDETGKTYIDFGSGIGTTSLGYCNEAWTEAVCRQVKTMQHTSNLYYTKVQADFAQQLCETTGYSKVFFCNSGAEANECAIKLARKYSFDKYGKGRHKILTLVNSFHGRTLCTLSATGQDVFHNYFFPFVEGFDYVTANDIADLKAKMDDTVCAVMLEYVQGEGGVNALKQEFVDAVFALCAEKDALVIADEVQTGVGRTGTFLAGEQFGHKADVTTLAKGIAGGLPMGACLASEKCADVLNKGAHGSTFGGNPVCCAGGLAVLQTVTAPGFLEDVQRKAALFREKLAALPGVASVSGLGLMIGIQLTDKKAIDVANAALEEGLLVLTAKDKVRLLPPLTMTDEEIEAGVAILAHVLGK
ncbi:aspartate aminotransferase family protein [Ruminococcus sp.]|uniref:aspartate aminotransferase family protein n=1 Tax=Ruminococcus sp. TaxID=41978 RepID=UPI0025D29F61|nr:aspartate aminotransferase family protein [Ruminococcus sp.]